MTKDKHVIIIGSGLGGLTSGYILAKNGYRVTVLEQNAQLGGCLQTFTRDGVKFETGMHYIGSMDEGQILNRFFRYFNLLNAMQFSRLDTEGYDIISIAGQHFPFANGSENFVETLSRFFPKERANLQNYCNYLSKITDYSVFYSGKEQSQNNFLKEPAFVNSASEFISSVTSDPLLKNVLSGSLPLYAGVEDKTPLYIHALIHDFYNKSAFRIVGGSDIITESLVKSIRSMGGEVHARQKVVKINCDDKKAISVSVNEDNNEIAADYIISSLHPCRTLELLDTHLIRKSYRSRINSLENTISSFTIYIRFKDNAMPYQNYNLFCSSEKDVWKNAGNYSPEKFPVGLLYMHSCSEPNQKYAQSAILISYMDFDEVAKWQGSQIGRRGSEYEEFKQEKAEILLDLLEQYVSGTRSAIAKYYTSTPLTYFDYTGTEKGSMYGILTDCKNFLNTKVFSRTKIPNLLFTGQNTNIHGIIGVMIGAVLTAGELTNTQDIIRQIYEE
ncbi:MAG: NAD(P)/FAD-dependent oxidoreductase [Bacteroidales bacterium]|jgi:all-trans-retinol 13,14-reductase|nr:NAD(P)/FAD-dependent oxidoreductase [Bacteroidales bacterium]